MKNKIIKLSILLPFIAALSVHAKLENKLYTKDIYKQDIRAQLNKLKTSNSLIITDPKILALLEEEHSLGQKLGELAYNEKVVSGRGSQDSPQYILKGFKQSINHVVKNNERMRRHKNGDFRNAPIIPYARGWRDFKTDDGVVKSRFLSTAIGVNKKTNINPYQKVINLWPALKNAQNGKTIKGSAEYRYSPSHLGKGPFRLLAIVNRMDLSGNLPRGSGPFGFVVPRAFGEVHFIYGLVDKEYERATKTAYPHTFQVTYRLPPIDWKHNVKTQYEKYSFKNKDLGTATHESFMIKGGHNKWRNNNQRWGRLWRQLSRIDINKQPQTFANHLHAMLERSATPDNFLNLNSNSAVGGMFNTRKGKLTQYEFELKAYYAQPKGAFNATELDREASRCMINTPFLRNVVNSFMKTYPANKPYFSKPVRDIMVWNPNFIIPDQDDPKYANTGNFNYSGRNAYMLGNTMNSKISPVSHPALNGNNHGYIGQTTIPGCEGSDQGKTPYMVLHHREVASPAIARTKWNFVWDFPKKRGLENVPEEARHAFAIRTCSGCHGKETRTNGFHIQNRLDNKTPKLSSFLNDNGVTTGKLVGNVRYRYNTIKHRKEWLYLSVERKNTIRAGMSLVRKSDERL